ncbi:hypothetical protein MASR1M12_01470 [Erysipelotrichia bacterium]
MQPFPASVTMGVNPLTASFTFSQPEITGRKYVVPDLVFFNASGSMQTYRPASAPINFPAWQSNYPAANWQSVLAVRPYTDGTLYENCVNAAQVPANYIQAGLQKNFLVTTMNLGSKDVYISCYSSEDKVFKEAPSFKTKVSTTTNSSKPHSMVVNKNRVIVFWLDSTNALRTASSIDCLTWTNHGEIIGSAISVNFGPAGTMLKRNGSEYISIAYPSSAAGTIRILTCQDSEFPGFQTTDISGLGNISGSVISIFQNPRTEEVFIAWLDNTQIKYKRGTFDPASTPRFTFEAATNALDAGQSFTNLGLSGFGGLNFDQSVVVSIAGGMKHYHPLNSNTNGTFPPPVSAGFASQFTYEKNNDLYAGLAILSDFKNFEFFSRKLSFPDECYWASETRVLHLEGPPFSASEIGVRVDFAEVLPSNSKAAAVNSGLVAGGLRPLNSSYRVIADAGNRFSIYFDKNMRVASYAEIIGTNTPIRLLDAANQPVNIIHDGGTGNEIYFKPAANLAFDATYTIMIASDVIDANGSQIYEDQQITFVTQTTSSQVAADEVASISLHTSPAYDAASRLIQATRSTPAPPSILSKRRRPGVQHNRHNHDQCLSEWLSHASGHRNPYRNRRKFKDISWQLYGFDTDRRQPRLPFSDNKKRCLS